ncbi:MAG TPA: endonuclease III [Chloroflexota bacterium]
MPRSLIRWAHRRLLEHYGRPEWIARNEPLDELIGTVLSQHTSDVNADRAFAGLKAAFDSWEAVRDAPAGALEQAIRGGGLAVVKGARIQAILRALSDERGRVALPDVGRMRRERARALLTRLPGVGTKTASCVLLFGAGVAAIPVDTHVHRVALRVGLVPPRTTPDQATTILEAAIPPKDYFAFHVNLIRHGRETCKAQHPRCEICVLRAKCAYLQT